MVIIFTVPNGFVPILDFSFRNWLSKAMVGQTDASVLRIRSMVRITTAVHYFHVPPRFITRTMINVPLAKRGNGYGSPRRLKFTRLDGTEVDLTLPGTDNFVSLLTWGRHCDILPAALFGSGTTHTCDEYLGASNDSGFIMLYVGHGSSSNSFSIVNSVCEDAFGLFNFGVNYNQTCRGSYLLFRGEIEETDDVDAFKKMQEI